jgi:twitching motility protein PilT
MRAERLHENRTNRIWLSAASPPDRYPFAMSDQRVPLLGRLAVHNRMISMSQLAETTEEQGRRSDGSSLGDILVEKGFINSEQLVKLVNAQRQMVTRQRASQAAKATAPGLETEPQKPKVAADPRSELMTPPAVEAPIATPAPSPAPAPEPKQEAPTAAPRPADTPSTPAAPSAAEPKPARSIESKTPVPDSPVVTLGGDLAVPSDADREAFNAMLKEAVARGSSDIHVHAGSPLTFRVNGQLAPGREGVVDAAQSELFAMSPLNAEQRDIFAQRGEIDICYSLDGVGRFRANVYRQQRGVDAVFRYIPPEAPSLDELGLPSSLAKFTNFHQGMVLVTGPAGCGKSSTLAALVDLINEERLEHILTIEDPIEYLHPSKRCLVNQRSVHSHTESFARALRAALREDPDVIVVGELRDLETISLALSAAETGHLVLATLHTNNAIRTLNRIIGAFPADQQGQVRMMISESLRVVISQRLIPRADGQGRVAAIENLVVNRAVGNLIRENKTFQIHSILQTGASQGMVLLDHSIKALLDAGTISREEALLNCEDAKVLGG